jgi:glycosyltransferase involved in cell wall biosynthesis
MAYGLSPIVTPVGAVIDVIRDGDNGILIPPGDADTIAGALSDLLLDPQKRRAIGKRARASFKADYDIRNYRGKLEAIYRTVLEHR